MFDMGEDFKTIHGNRYATMVVIQKSRFAMLFLHKDKTAAKIKYPNLIESCKVRYRIHVMVFITENTRWSKDQPAESSENGIYVFYASGGSAPSLPPDSPLPGSVPRCFSSDQRWDLPRRECRRKGRGREPATPPSCSSPGAPGLASPFPRSDMSALHQQPSHQAWCVLFLRV